MCTSPWHASIIFVSMSVLCLISLKYEVTTLLLCVHAVSVIRVLEIMMTICQQFPRLRYVCRNGLGLVLLCCQEAAQ